jgi:acyl-CoA thioesterase
MTERFPGTPADLAADTAVTRLERAPGWYTASLPPHWSFRTPSGGVLMATALRAMREELGDPDYRPVSATTVFCSPVPEGPVEIRVEILRKGGAAAQIRAALSSTALPGPGLEVSATFARERTGIDFCDAEFPAVPMPDDCESMDEDARSNPHTVVQFFHNFESRLALGNKWWTGPTWEAGPARFARWFRFKRPQVRDGRLDRLALPALADLMPPALVMKVGPNGPYFHAPSLDLTVHFLEDTTSEWFLISTYARRARAGYAQAEVEIWSLDQKLIAYGTQTMILRERKKRSK